MVLVIVCGPPGSGKTTYCKNQTQYKHILLGDLLREEGKTNIIIQKCMKNGILIPTAITMSVLKSVLTNPDEDYIIDGFPRNMENCIALEEAGWHPTSIIFFNLPEHICVERLMNRKRFDDVGHCITKRIETFKRETLPVVDYYIQKGITITYM